MHIEDQINVLENDKVINLKSSIDNLRDKLYVKDLKRELSEFVNSNIELDQSVNYLKKEIITDAPYWFPKAQLSRTQSDLIAISSDGEEYIFLIILLHHLPSIQTTNGLMFHGD